MSGSVLKIAVSEEVMSRLSSSARESHRGETEIVEDAISEYLDRQDIELAAVERGMLLAAEDGLISHEAMKAWLLSWGDGDELPAPEPDVVRRK